MSIKPPRRLSKTGSAQLSEALKLHRGARFYKCALQVNPFAYLKRHSKVTAFSSEADYNEAIVAACIEHKIRVLGVTDHYRIEDSWTLIEAAREAGLFVFAGFEAVSKDGVHFLCLFDAEHEKKLERFIGECGITDSDVPSPIGKFDATELMQAASEWGASCIAAHALAEGGLLRKLSGQTRIQAWRSEHLLACAIAGPVNSAPMQGKTILENKDAAHRRDRLVAVINASDVNAPEDLSKAGATTFIKMSVPSVEALRQAFLDPESRVRLNSDPEPDPHSEFLAITWEGGFLDGTAIHFSPNLNVLIGGRGAGKSTVIESIRYVLGRQPVGEDAKKSHDGVIKQVLQSGTKVSLLVRSHQPSEAFYTIERSVPNRPVIKDRNGVVMSVSVEDILEEIQVFGQHEISELTKSRDKLTMLLERFVDSSGLESEKSDLANKLQISRAKLGGLNREMARIDERLAELPALEETLKRYKAAGLEDKLKNRSALVREEGVLKAVDEQADPFRDLLVALDEQLPIDIEFLSAKELKGLPNEKVISALRAPAKELEASLQAVKDTLKAALAAFDDDVAGIKKKWATARQSIQTDYERLLRELQRSKIDGQEFIRLKEKIETLRPLSQKKNELSKDLETRHAQRRTLLGRWQDVKDREFQLIQAAAKSVSRKLRDRVRVTVTMSGDRKHLEELLRDKVGGSLAAAIDRLNEREALSLSDLAEHCRDGKEALQSEYEFPSGVADRLSRAGDDVFMAIEELELPATTTIELNTAAEGAPTTWRTLEELSTGQKATAVLLLLLLESEAPLIIDQPEDDLDNRFIADGVVPTMRLEKRRRQFIFSTHNANIPVLGDAELIVGMTATGEAAAIRPEHRGSIDSEQVCTLVGEILEGGRTAFETRRSKYGF